MSWYILGLIVLGIYCVVLNLKLNSLRQITIKDKTSLELELSEAKKEFSELSNETPRTFINDKNEAIITLPDGTEIHNYKLKKEEQ